MKKIIAAILTIMFQGAFALLLLIFHPLQVIALNVWGYHAHKKVVDVLNYFIVKSLWLGGVKVSFNGFDKIPANCPIIIVSNHQSQYDIPPVVWGFRKNHPKFISKIELAKNIPSISYNLRHGGSAIIDRSKGAQSIKEIVKLGRMIEEKNYCACIFPEGTRSKTGKVKAFQVGGIKTLMKVAPSSIIVPLVIDGNYKLQGNFPIPLGTKVSYTVLDPIVPNGMAAEEIVMQTEKAIKAALGQRD